MLGWLAVLLVIAVPVGFIAWYFRRPVDRTDAEPKRADSDGDSEDVTRDILLRSGDDSVQDAVDVLGHNDAMHTPRSGL